MSKKFIVLLGIVCLFSCSRESESVSEQGNITLNLNTVQREWSDLGKASKSVFGKKEDVLTDLRGNISIEDPLCVLLRDISKSLEEPTENKLSVEFKGLLINSDNPEEKYPKFLVKNFTEETAGIYYGETAVIEMELTNGVWRALQAEYVEGKQQAWITSYFPTTWFEDIFGAQLTGNWRVSSTTGTPEDLIIDMVNPGISVLSNEIQSCDSEQLLCQTGSVIVDDLGNMQNGLDEEYTLFINGVQKDGETNELYFRYGLVAGTAVDKIIMKPVTRDNASGTALVPEIQGVELTQGDIMFFSIPLDIYSDSNPLIYINFDLVSDQTVVTKNLSTSLKAYYDNILAGTIDNTFPFLELNVCAKKPEYNCDYPAIPEIELPDQFQVRFKNNPARPGEEFVFWPVNTGQTTFDIPLGKWDVEVSSWNEENGALPEFSAMPVFYGGIAQQDFGLNAVADLGVESISSATLIAKNNLDVADQPVMQITGNSSEPGVSLTDAGDYWLIYPLIGTDDIFKSFDITTTDIEGKVVQTTSQQQASVIYRFMVCPSASKPQSNIENIK